jgi:modulator of FtsH protease
VGLYDRDYANQNQSQGYFDSGVMHRTEAEIVTFVKDTYKLFAASMLAGSVGAYMGVMMAATVQAYKWPLFFLEIGLLLILLFTKVKHKPGINMILLFAFTLMTGITLGPLLSMTLGMQGGGTIVGNAFLMTTVIFGGMSLFAINTTKDFSGYGKPLFIALIVIIAGSLLNMFFFQSPMMHIIIQGAVVLLFSFLVIYDTQNIIRGAYETPIDGAIALYLDFLNIFTALLQLLGIFNSDD